MIAAAAQKPTRAKRRPNRKLNFTDRKIADLPTPTAGRTLVRDARTHGLVLTVQPSGERAFAWYRKVKGYPRWHSLGRFPDMTVEQARGKASDMNSKLALEQNPFEERGLTFGAAFGRYVDEHLATATKNPQRAMKAAQAKLAQLPAWQKRPLEQLQREDVRALHVDLKRTKGVFAANRMLQTVKAMLNWAIDENYSPAPIRRRASAFSPSPSGHAFYSPTSFHDYLRH